MSSSANISEASLVLMVDDDVSSDTIYCKAIALIRHAGRESRVGSATARL
jgi:hypothetical protein